MEKVRNDLLEIRRMFERDRRTSSLDYQKKKLQIADSKDKLGRAHKYQEEHEKKNQDYRNKHGDMEDEIEKLDNEINALKDEMNEINEQIIKYDNHKLTMEQDRRRVDISMQEYYAAETVAKLKQEEEKAALSVS